MLQEPFFDDQGNRVIGQPDGQHIALMSTITNDEVVGIGFKKRSPIGIHEGDKEQTTVRPLLRLC